MSRYEFDLATDSDDAELRGILSATPMPGKISVSFQREPSYFDGAVVEGRLRQVAVCRDRTTNRIIGCGCRSVRERYVNGHPQPIGYLSLLRLLDDYRNLGLVARGYRYLRQLHRDGLTELYLTTIAQGNEPAVSVLSSARANLPSYHPAGDYHSTLISTKRFRHLAVRQDIHVRPATRADVDPLVQFLTRVGPSRQFFPRYEAADFVDPQGTFKELGPADLLLAFQHDRLVGVLGGWDQHKFRQTVVHRIDSPLRWWRPIVNSLAALRGGPKLPKPGESLRYICGVLPIVANNDLTVFSTLLDSLLDHLATSRHDYFLVGMHEADPLLPLVSQRASATYVTHMYYVCWDDGEELRGQLDNRPPYLELGCL